MTLPDPLSGRAPSTPFFPVLLAAFAASGCAALVYEIVWFQLLELVIGSTAVSMAVLLGTYMGGMCLGSLAFPRLVSRHRHPLRVYGLLELGIGAFGLLILFFMPAVVRLYAGTVGPGLAGILLRGAVCVLCLVPPTVLMGATLPAVARWLETTPAGVSRLGFLYGANTAGAVSGSLLAGFYLLRIHDMATATFAAASVNAGLALLAFALARARKPAPLAAEPPASSLRVRGAGAVYAAIALSGFTALGAEVAWTRLLSLLLGGTVYTFSLILAVFLLGLALGSTAGAAAAKRVRSPRLALGWCQVLLAAAIAWTAVQAASSLPYWPINPTLAKSAWAWIQLDLVRCLWALLPATLLWGASFPLALAAAAAPGQDPGRLAGRVYAANTIGAIAGSIGTGLLLIPWLGTSGTQRLLIAGTAVAALLGLAPLLRRPAARTGAPARGSAFALRPAGIAAVAAAFALAAAAARLVPPVPVELIAHGRSLASKLEVGKSLFVGEGMNASVAVTELESGIRNFHVSGKVEASNDPQDMRVERLLGHIPGLFHPDPKSVLVVGCGAGVTTGSFTLYPRMEKIVLCEIEPLIPRVVARFFGPENYDVLDDPRLRLVIDDARHFVLTSKDRFDVITSDPIHPWVKGSATLYSREYFEMCRKLLNPGGVMAQWVPLYQSRPETVKSELATFFEVFPNGTVWSNDFQGWGYDVVLLGWNGPGTIDVDALEARLASPEYRDVTFSLGAVGFSSAIDLLATYAGRAADLGTWLRGAPINRDRNLRLQYLAGLGLNEFLSGAIYSEMLKSRIYPTELFRASPAAEAALRKALGMGEAGKRP